MDITITVNIPALDRLVDKIDGQLAGNASAPAEDKPKRQSAKKSEPASSGTDAAGAASEGSTAGTETSGSTTSTSSTATSSASPSDLTGTEEEQIAQVKEKAMLLNQKKGRDVLVSTLGEFGAANISALAADKRAAFIARVEELTNA